jgi:hypothetical protein
MLSKLQKKVKNSLISDAFGLVRAEAAQVATEGSASQAKMWLPFLKAAIIPDVDAVLYTPSRIMECLEAGNSLSKNRVIPERMFQQKFSV